MIATEDQTGDRFATNNAWLMLSLVLTFFLATLTLWIPARLPVAIFEIVVFLIAAAAIALGRVPPIGTRFPMFSVGFIVLWGGLQLVAGLTVDRFATERATVQWMTWLAVYYVGASLLQQEDLARIVRKVLVWFGFALAIEAILQAYLSPGKVFGLFPTGYHDFVMGPIVYHTHFAAFIETVLPIAIFFALSEIGNSYVCLAVTAVLLTSLVVSGSRGGIIIACVEVIGVLVLWYPRTPRAARRTGFVALALAGITTVLTLIVGFETVSERFAETLAAGRVQFIFSTLHMIAAHPLMGWGLGCWPAVYPAFATFDPGALVNQAHCDWLQWTAEGGLPVGLAMLALALWAVRPATRSIWGIGVIAVFIHAAFDYPFSRPAVGGWPFLILSMAAAARYSNSDDLFGADRR